MNESVHPQRNMKTLVQQSGIVRRRRVLLLAGMSIFVLTFLVWFCWPARPNLHGFNAEGMARLETAMWRDYYAKDWTALARHTWQVARRQYGFSRVDSLRLAWHAARAARAFQRNTIDDDAVTAMTDYYRVIIGQAASASFNAAEAAKLEVQWWRQRRKGEPPEEWGRTLAGLLALIYDRPAEALYSAAQARVDAMVYRDARRGTRLTVKEWHEVERQLCVAYRQLKLAVTSSTAGDCQNTGIITEDEPPLHLLTVDYPKYYQQKSISD